MEIQHLGEFPPARQLWGGTLLATIAAAIWVVADESYFGGRSWDGSYYWLNNEQGAFGVIAFKDPIAFQDHRLVGLLCDLESERAAWDGRIPPDWRLRLAGMPSDVRAWAERDLIEYMKLAELDDAEHTLVPVITAAFWSEGERLAAAEPWPDVLVHGGRAIRAEVLEFDGAIGVLDEFFGFSDGDEEHLVALLRGLFQRKMADSQSLVVIQPWEQEVLESYGNAGIDRARRLLAAVGIILP